MEVASASLVTRSKLQGTQRVPCFIWYRSQVVRPRSAKPLFASSNLAGTSKTKRTSERMSFLFWTLPRQDLKILNATVRWTVAGTSSKTGGYFYLYVPLRSIKMQSNLADMCLVSTKQIYPDLLLSASIRKQWKIWNLCHLRKPCQAVYNT